jgi:hypothetical protein
MRSSLLITALVLLFSYPSFATPQSDVEDGLREALILRQELLSFAKLRSVQNQTWHQSMQGSGSGSGTMGGSSKGFFSSNSFGGSWSSSSQQSGFSQVPMETNFEIWIATDEQLSNAQQILGRATQEFRAATSTAESLNALDTVRQDINNHFNYNTDVMNRWLTSAAVIKNVHNFLEKPYMTPEMYMTFTAKINRIGEILQKLEITVPFAPGLDSNLVSEYNALRYWAMNSTFTTNVINGDFLTTENVTYKKLVAVTVEQAVRFLWYRGTSSTRKFEWIEKQYDMISQRFDECISIFKAKVWR